MSTAPGVPVKTAWIWLWKTRVFSRVMARYASKCQVRLAAAVQQLALLVLLTALQQTRAECRHICMYYESGSQGLANEAILGTFFPVRAVLVVL
jgi:hypothetical protein